MPIRSAQAVEEHMYMLVGVDCLEVWFQKAFAKLATSMRSSDMLVDICQLSILFDVARCSLDLFILFGVCGCIPFTCVD